MLWRSVSEKVIDSLHMSLHSMERAQCIRFSCLTGAGMSSCDTEAGGIILLHRQGKVNKSRDVGLVEPDVLETGCSGLDASQHPPAGDQGNVPSCKSVIEPIATPSDIESALEGYMEELKFEGVLEGCRSLAALDASEDLLHQQV